MVTVRTVEDLVLVASDVLVRAGAGPVVASRNGGRVQLEANGWIALVWGGVAPVSVADLERLAGRASVGSRRAVFFGFQPPERAAAAFAAAARVGVLQVGFDGSIVEANEAAKPLIHVEPADREPPAGWTAYPTEGPQCPDCGGQTYGEVADSPRLVVCRCGRSWDYSELVDSAPHLAAAAFRRSEAQLWLRGVVAVRVDGSEMVHLAHAGGNQTLCEIRRSLTEAPGWRSDCRRCSAQNAEIAQRAREGLAQSALAAQGDEDAVEEALSDIRYWDRDSEIDLE